MKRMLGLLLVVCATQLPLLAQVTIPFTINFPVFPGGPSGSAELLGNLFTVQTTPWTFAPDSGRIVEMAENGSTNLIFQFATALIDTHQVTDPLGNPMEITSYHYFESWNLIPPQSESLLAGRWFMEVAFGPSTLVSQITPVPEPNIPVILILGIGITMACRRRYHCVGHPNSWQRLQNGLSQV